MRAVILLWREVYLSAAAALVRLLFELWGASHLMTNEFKAFTQSKDLVRLTLVVNKLYEGVRSEVLLPWGAPAAEKPVHALETIRSLNTVLPDAVRVYEDLCESTHANQPRFVEWWFLGKDGDNWTNRTVKA